MNPITAYFAPYKLLIEVAAIGALVIGISLAIHSFLEHERDIGRNEVRAEYAAQLKIAKEDAERREALLRAQVDEATKNANDREQTIRSLATSAGISSNSLRDTLTSIRNGVPSASIEALGKSTATLATVLADCQGKYRSMAEIADRHASDTKTLEDSWPTYQKKTQ